MRENTVRQSARCTIKIFREGEGVVDGEGVAMKGLEVGWWGIIKGSF